MATKRNQTEPLEVTRIFRPDRAKQVAVLNYILSLPLPPQAILELEEAMEVEIVRDKAA